MTWQGHPVRGERGGFDQPTRRAFLKAAAVVPSIFACQRTLADEFHGSDFWERPRYVWMRRPETGEHIRETYWADGQLIDAAYRRISWFMRDWHMERRIASLTSRGQPVPSDWYAGVGISPITLDIVYATSGWLDHFGVGRALVLDSGFRHPMTNAVTEHAARNSLHQFGRAVDLVIPGIDAMAVGRYGVWLSAGGVGFYPGKTFTHLDDGRLRTWHGNSGNSGNPREKKAAHK